MITPVSSSAFVTALERRWVAYGNVPSAALRAAWTDLCGVFNAQVTAPSDCWPVIPAELGVGKTTAAKLYCAMLPTPGPGVLFVGGTIDQAEEVARDINTWAGRTVAMPYHSKLSAAERQDLDVLATYPTLVICHRQFEVGLDALAMNESYPKFKKLHEYSGGTRGLVIVDEALDQIHESRVHRD